MSDKSPASDRASAGDPNSSLPDHLSIPTFIVLVTNTLVSARRIDAFLNEEEITPKPSTSTEPSSGISAVGFAGDARFRWNAAPSSPAAEASPSSARAFELGPLAFMFPSGALTVVTGPIGAGKSALLLALLGEMDAVQGSVLLARGSGRVDDVVAYAAQTAWLQDMSIKENILFGAQMDQPRYDAVVKACCLLPDFAILEDGDGTEIGSKGVSLSGGQKARVALARATYSRARVSRDDPLVI